MTDQEKPQDQPTAETEATEAEVTEQGHEGQPPEQVDDLNETSENLEESSEEQQPEQADCLKETTENIKETSEKIWGSTKNAWNTAAFKAVQYKKLVQMKIDQSALHKKISIAHADLGKLIDDLSETGKKNIMNLAEVKELLERLDELKSNSAALEEKTEQTRNAEPPMEDPQEKEETE